MMITPTRREREREKSYPTFFEGSWILISEVISNLILVSQVSPDPSITGRNESQTKWLVGSSSFRVNLIKVGQSTGGKA